MTINEFRTDLTDDEQQKLITYARSGCYPRQELRFVTPRLKEGKLVGLGAYCNSVLISCDADNAVLMFKNKYTQTIDDDFTSITAISYNPKTNEEIDPNWHFNPYPDNKNIFDSQKKVPTPKTIVNLDKTRSFILTSFIEDEVHPDLQNRSYNRLIQCDLCVQPSSNGVQMKINNDNVIQWNTLYAAMEKSQLLFLGWGNGAYKEPYTLMGALKQCPNFNVSAFYNYLKKRVANNEVYAFKTAKKTKQPMQPTARISHDLQVMTLKDLQQMFATDATQVK